MENLCRQEHSTSEAISPEESLAVRTRLHRPYRWEEVFALGHLLHCLRDISHQYRFMLISASPDRLE